ncbi:MAG: hypothetical protein Fur0015_05770 [Ignavibacteriales bacterium]
MSDNASRPKLLIVEDDLENQKFLNIFLKRTFEIDICDSADTFYEKINETDFDIILMDISLRGNKDGLEITRELRKRDDRLKNIPIIGLSAHAFQRDKDNAYKAGIDAFLTKPVQNDILLNTIMQVYKEKNSK